MRTIWQFIEHQGISDCVWVMGCVSHNYDRSFVQYYIYKSTHDRYTRGDQKVLQLGYKKITYYMLGL